MKTPCRIVRVVCKWCIQVEIVFGGATQWRFRNRADSLLGATYFTMATSAVAAYTPRDFLGRLWERAGKPDRKALLPNTPRSAMFCRPLVLHWLAERVEAAEKSVMMGQIKQLAGSLVQFCGDLGTLQMSFKQQFQCQK